mmetsp:Transcript_13919/g.17067  ORF Transcript_13919/g.17067 Transcript_13919/m.17067 type:complete len:163 (+) Transcript_13919:445-933(+)
MLSSVKQLLNDSPSSRSESYNDVNAVDPMMLAMTWKISVPAMTSVTEPTSIMMTISKIYSFSIQLPMLRPMPPLKKREKSLPLSAAKHAKIGLSKTAPTASDLLGHPNWRAGCRITGWLSMIIHAVRSILRETVALVATHQSDSRPDTDVELISQDAHRFGT